MDCDDFRESLECVTHPRDLYVRFVLDLIRHHQECLNCQEHLAKILNEEKMHGTPADVRRAERIGRKMSRKIRKHLGGGLK